MVEPRRATPRPARSASRRAPSSRGGGLKVRRMARAADDGYEHELLPGLRSSADVGRLADEMAFAAARLEELSTDPPGLYADVANASDVEEATWLAFLIAYLSPLEGDDPWAGIAAARTSWASGELPMLEDVALGPRAAHDPARGASTLLAYRAWAERPARRRRPSSATPPGPISAASTARSSASRSRASGAPALRAAGDARPPRRLRGAPVVAAALGRPLDPTIVASKRVLGIGDPLLLSAARTTSPSASASRSRPSTSRWPTGCVPKASASPPARRSAPRAPARRHRRCAGRVVPALAVLRGAYCRIEGRALPAANVGLPPPGGGRTTFGARLGGRPCPVSGGARRILPHRGTASRRLPGRVPGA